MPSYELTTPWFDAATGTHHPAGEVVDISGERAAFLDAVKTDAEPDDAPAAPFDAEQFLEEHGTVDAIEAAIERGDADGHLDAVRAAEGPTDGDGRVGVHEALDERESEYGGEE